MRAQWFNGMDSNVEKCDVVELSFKKVDRRVVFLTRYM